MSTRTRLFIFGAGSHGRVVAESAIASGQFELAGFVDDKKASTRSSNSTAASQSQQEPPLPAPTITLAHLTPEPDARIIVAVGDNAVRARITRKLLSLKWQLANVIHPTAWVSPTAVLAQGVYIGPQAAVNAMAKLDQGVIVNTGAVIEHHCHVESFAHCCPRSALAGHVTVGSMTLLGTGASVRPKVNIGRDCVIGAGAAVVHDIPAGRLAMGVPAQCFDPAAHDAMA